MHDNDNYCVQMEYDCCNKPNSVEKAEPHSCHKCGALVAIVFISLTDHMITFSSEHVPQKGTCITSLHWPQDAGGLNLKCTVAQ